MRDLFVRPDFDNSKIHVSFTLPDGCNGIDYQIREDDGLVTSGNVETSEKAGSFEFEVSLPRFKPWTVDSPFMYLLQMRLQVDGKPVDLSQTFAMTKVHVQDRQVFFNNIPLYIRGFIRGRKGHEHANITGVSTTEFYEKSIRMAKAFGFNFIRFHSLLPPEEFFEAADRLGILCHVEIRKYYGRYQKERESTGFDDDQQLVEEADWEDMLLRLRNHPSVLVYCMGNEINSPGNNERVHSIRDLTRRLDPTRLFLDTCSRGEYDRDTVDIDVQHMSYFAPYGRHYDMFDDSIHLSIYGSISGKPMVVQDSEEEPAFVMRREVPVKFPLLAHEVCHYIALRDPYELDRKYRECGAEKPWWIDELIKMIRSKGHESQYDKMLQASTRFQYIWIKQGFESIRKSPLLGGFHFLQLSDSDDYENANGLLDCFDDPKCIQPDDVLPFNDSTVIVADLPNRALAERSQLRVPIILSHYATDEYSGGTFHWRLEARNGGTISMQGEMADCDLRRHGTQSLCRLEINLPKLEKPECLDFDCRLVSDDGEHATHNHWDLWAFPDNPNRIAPITATVDLRELKLYKRYPQITNKGDLQNTEQLLITDRFSKAVIDHLADGKDVLLLYRIEENRDKTAQREEYYLPSTWERFKGIIWDRGHNSGGFLRDHPIVRDFPHDGFIDWQFYDLIEDCDKIDMDDFPVAVEPIIEGVDKAVRDRYDVGRFDLSEFQYEYTMRKFAYLFELRVGSGRLLVTGMNFKGMETDVPSTCWMFENMVNYMLSKEFNPSSSLSVDQLSSYLLEKGKSKRIKERMMTQYWQLDDAPLESKRYWKESEEWLRCEEERNP